VKKDLLFPLRRFHGFLYETKLHKDRKRQIKKQFLKQFLEKSKVKKCVFLILTPEHTNLGDHAIALAEFELLAKLGIDYVEVTGAQLLEISEYNLLGMFNKYPIFINGGGNLGTLWLDVEQLTRDVIKSNPRSEIVIFPNTFYYEDSLFGRQELANSIAIYNSHKNLHIYAREKVSFEKMKGIYRDVRLVPDMVLSLNLPKKHTIRKGCLLCMRGDCERTISDSDSSMLMERLIAKFGHDIAITDMHTKSDLPPENRTAALEEKFDEFRAVKLVVTDRLHGMIFCAITGTPCVVVNSKSHKVEGCYDWIKNLEYIKFCSDVNDFDDILDSMNYTEYDYDNSHLLSDYQQLEKDLLEFLS